MELKVNSKMGARVWLEKEKIKQINHEANTKKRMRFNNKSNGKEMRPPPHHHPIEI